MLDYSQLPLDNKLSRIFIHISWQNLHLETDSQTTAERYANHFSRELQSCRFRPNEDPFWVSVAGRHTCPPASPWRSCTLWCFSHYQFALSAHAPPFSSLCRSLYSCAGSSTWSGPGQKRNGWETAGELTLPWGETCGHRAGWRVSGRWQRRVLHFQVAYFCIWLHPPAVPRASGHRRDLHVARRLSTRRSTLTHIRLLHITEHQEPL